MNEWRHRVSSQGNAKALNASAGEYPGLGSRNIADDGHEVSVSLTSVVLP